MSQQAEAAEGVEVEEESDDRCKVCGYDEGEQDNEIVFCDGCNVPVHQACYGLGELPEGAWLCEPCKENKHSTKIQCAICLKRGGAFKPVDGTRWAHVCCVMWLPETYFADVTKVEGVKGIEAIDRERSKLKCVVCNTRGGACIQCTYGVCVRAFHVSCALEKNSDCVLELMEDDGNVVFRALCPPHKNTEYKRKRVPKRAGKRNNRPNMVAADDDEDEEEEEEDFTPVKTSQSTPSSSRRAGSGAAAAAAAAASQQQQQADDFGEGGSQENYLPKKRGRKKLSELAESGGNDEGGNNTTMTTTTTSTASALDADTFQRRLMLRDALLALERQQPLHTLHPNVSSIVITAAVAAGITIPSLEQTGKKGKLLLKENLTEEQLQVKMLQSQLMNGQLHPSVIFSMPAMCSSLFDDEIVDIPKVDILPEDEVKKLALRDFVDSLTDNTCHDADFMEPVHALGDSKCGGLPFFDDTLPQPYYQVVDPPKAIAALNFATIPVNAKKRKTDVDGLLDKNAKELLRLIGLRNTEDPNGTLTDQKILVQSVSDRIVAMMADLPPNVVVDAKKLRRTNTYFTSIRNQQK